MKKILFLCTHNSARSQMAEGWLRQLGEGSFSAYSAGTIKTSIRPEAIKVMNEVGIDMSGQYSKDLDQFINVDFDEVITVCDKANDSCPIFPNAKKENIGVSQTRQRLQVPKKIYSKFIGIQETR